MEESTLMQIKTLHAYNNALIL